jgi:lysophospholipid acyltransferase (LPLAT)-like uncharacterized protein
LKEFKKRVLLFLARKCGFILIKAIYLSCRKKFIFPSFIPKEPFIVAFWHRELLMQPFLYKRLRNNHKIAVMISKHFDGEIIAKIIEGFSFETVRGSKKRGAIAALLQAIKKIKKGYDIAITPDGPRGPIYTVADGIVAIAQKCDAFIVPFSYEASSSWELKSWDKFIIPRPFSTITLKAKEPFKITNLSKDEAKEKIKMNMRRD